MKRNRHILSVFAAFCTVVTSTSADDQNYTLNVIPFMSLEALRGPNFAEHPLTADNVVLSDSRWRARSSSTTGSTVTFETNHSFWNTTAPEIKRDAILRLTRLQGPPTGGWTITVAEDQTDYASGDEVASVSMASVGPGMQMVRMEVEFITGNLSTLRGGNYELVVTGTITQN